jgi:hypothetical protein
VAAEEFNGTPGLRLSHHVPRAVELLCAHLSDDLRDLERAQVVSVTKDVEILLRACRKAPMRGDVLRERLDDIFDCYRAEWRANALAVKHALDPAAKSGVVQGPAQTAAEVVELALRYPARTIFTWKRRRSSIIQDRRVRALRALEFFVDALIGATHPTARTILYDVQEMVSAELSRRGRVAGKVQAP